MRHRQVVALTAVAALVIVLAVVVFGGGGGRGSGGAGGGKGAAGSPGVAAAATAGTLPAAPAARLLAGPPRSETLPGGSPAMTWPATGQAAVGVQGVGLMASTPHEASMPIASMTKMMTALVVVHDHPLAAGQSGPVLTMSRSDVATWVDDSESGDSSVPVKLGEKLSELQLLEALLIPSGDNIARTLAVWDAGSQAAFVAKMNATAKAMGLRNTHYGDPAGLSTQSRSTAADQVVVAEAVMAVPALRLVVAQSHVAFPVAGTIWNYNPALDVDGIVGVKSGFTSAAQACLATAVFEDVGGRRELVVAVSMHQPDGLSEAAQVDETLLSSAEQDLRPYRVIGPRAAVAPVQVPWASEHLDALGPAGGVTVLGWAGLRLSEQVVAGPALHVDVPAGAYAGRLVVSAAGTGTELADVVLRLSGPVLSEQQWAAEPHATHSHPTRSHPGQPRPAHSHPGQPHPGQPHTRLSRTSSSS
ncbi:MAG TPA: hypothetical protein VMD59_09035 [Acidimicrobiales bacterium]|nr:hypothetical protein [Acidimicrobiales bacterium]